jgi:hypothetical protein
MCVRVYSSGGVTSKHLKTPLDQLSQPSNLTQGAVCKKDHHSSANIIDKYNTNITSHLAFPTGSVSITMDQSNYNASGYPYLMSDVAYDIFAAQFGAHVVSSPRSQR